jgi:redox-regulated HSP33 family molecular chaperone
MKIERRDQDRQVRAYGDLKPGDVFEFCEEGTVGDGVFMVTSMPDDDGDNYYVDLDDGTVESCVPEYGVTRLIAKLVVEGEA